MAEIGEVLSSQTEGPVCLLVDPDALDGEYLDGQTVLYSGQTIQLEDGTTAFLQPNVSTENLHEVRLEDGTTAYIALSVPMLESLELENLPVGVETVNVSNDDLQVAMVDQEETEDKEKYIFSYVAMTAEEEEDEVEDGNQMEETEEGLDPLHNAPVTIIPTTSKPSRVYSIRAPRPPKTFVCQEDGCGKKYSAQHHLKVHVRSHTGSRPFKCADRNCDKMFRTNYALKAHVRTHTGEKPYKCPGTDCGKSFKTSGDLQKHIRTHTGERPFKCPVPGCNRAFTTSNIRKVHMRTHTGERPYECTHAGCNRAFASATNFKNHMRIHSGEKPYVCMNKSCGRRFTEYSSLYKHQTVHTQHKPFECQECGRHYRQSSTLTMHRRTAHGIIQTVDGTEVMLALPLPLSLQSAGTKLDSFTFVELGKDGEESLMTVEDGDGDADDNEDADDDVDVDGEGDASATGKAQGVTSDISMTLASASGSASGSESDEGGSRIDDSPLTRILVVADNDELLAVECFDGDEIIA